MIILVINGPNLNLLGSREPSTYGSETLEQLEQMWTDHAERTGVGIDTFQSNHEGAIIDAIQGAAGSADGIVLNAGALSHYSYAIYDALVAVQLPVVEIHISNIHERESWRRISVTGQAAISVMSGRGTIGYINAIDHLVAYLNDPPTTLTYDERVEPPGSLDLRSSHSRDASGIVLLIHGGFFRAEWARDVMSPMAAALVRHGWSTANMEYRRGPASLPDAVADVASAVDWLRSQSANLGVNPDRIVIVGHSAGGYLGLRQAHADSDLLGVIALAPITDPIAMSQVGPVDDPMAVAVGSPRGTETERWVDADLPGGPLSPVHVIHGTDDSVVPAEQSRTYAAAHEAVIGLQLSGVDHMELIDPHDESFSTLLDALDQIRLR